MASERKATAKLGEHRGNPRLWLEGQWLQKIAGFSPDDRFVAEFSKGTLIIRRTAEGDRKVSGKKNRTVPVIDINSAALREAFGNAETLQVTAKDSVITVCLSAVLRAVAERQQNFTEGSLFSGGGLLTEAARQMGFTPKFAVEIDADYAEVFERNHPEATMYNMSAEQVPWEALRMYRPLGLLTMGIPCEPYSLARHWDRGTDENGKQIRRDRSLPPEAHPAGDMVFWALRAVDATNAHTVLIENVPDFLKSGAYQILRLALERMGYNVDARVVNPTEHGELTTRKRAIIVARTGAAVVWPEVLPQVRRLGEIFDAPDAVKDEWFDETTKPWLFKHWREQTAKGNGFASQQITADSPVVGTITKRYFAQQGQHPVVRHPDRDGVFRWFTLSEVKKLHNIPDHYYLGDTKTLTGEIIGQGVVVSTMSKIIAANLAQAGLASA